MDFDGIELGHLRRMSRREYMHLIDIGFFDEDEPVELLRGFLVKMNAPGAPHAEIVERLVEFFILGLKKRARVRSENGFAASDESLPQPDIMVFPNGDYLADHPAKALLLIEVSHDSIRIDRGLKSGIYAEADVDEYWIVNLNERCLEVRDQPKRGGVFTRTRIFREGESVAPAAFPDLVLDVARVLP